MSKVGAVEQSLANCGEKQRRQIFNDLRHQVPIHPLETKLNLRAETILDLIQLAGPPALAAIRRELPAAAFSLYVVKPLRGWRDQRPAGEHPFDFLVRDAIGQVRVQVRLQSLKGHRAMMANQGYKDLPADMYVVETQRTRGGTEPHTKESTRPYRFGEFDILAVSMHPSTNNWSAFMYTVSDWLIPRPEDANLMLKFQPVSKIPDLNWTDSFNQCVKWLRSGEKKQIWRLPTQTRSKS